MYATVEFVGHSYTMTTEVEIGEKRDYDYRQELHEMAVEQAMKQIKQHYGWNIATTYFYTNVILPNDEEEA